MINLKSDENILYEESPGKGFIGYRFFTRVLGYGLLILVALGWIPFFFKFIGVEIKGLIYYIIGFIILLLLMFVYQIFLIKTHKYYITNQRVYAQAGLISKRKRSIGFNKITDITVHQNVFEKMFSVSNLSIQTAGMSGRPEITFLGIKDAAVPEKLLRRLKK